MARDFSVRVVHDAMCHLGSETCPVCGKRFEYTAGWYWIGEKYVKFCSYSCMRADERRREARPANWKRSGRKKSDEGFEN